MLSDRIAKMYHSLAILIRWTFDMESGHAKLPRLINLGLSHPGPLYFESNARATLSGQWAPLSLTLGNS